MKMRKFFKMIYIIGFMVLISNINAAAQRGDQVLASAGGNTLKESHVQVYVKMLEFIIGGKIKPAEVAEIRAESVREFKKDQASFFENVNQTDTLMNQVYQLTEPIQIAEGRMLFIGEFHKIAQTTSPNELSSVIKIANRYVKVLHYDPATSLLLTNKDIEAVLNYIDFTRKLHGMAALTAAEKTNFRTAVPDFYAELSNEHKAVFPVMPILWEIIDKEWKRMTPKQRDEAVAQMGIQKAQKPTPPAVAEPPAPRNRKLTQAQQLNRRMMYRTMSNMMLQNHATTMNAISNIGGSSDYWSVRNY